MLMITIIVYNYDDIMLIITATLKETISVAVRPAWRKPDVIFYLRIRLVALLWLVLVTQNV